VNSRELKYAAYWSIGLLAALVIAMIFSVALLPLVTAAICVIMMALIYGESHDLLDGRAAFYLATFAFIAMPSIALTADFRLDEPYWYSVGNDHLIISHSDLDAAQRIIFFGLIAVTVPILIHIARSGPMSPVVTTEPEIQPVIWLVYSFVLAAYIGITFLQFGGPASILHYATDPVARLEKSEGGQLLSGISGLLAFASEVSAYYLCRRLKRRVFGIVFFVPIIFCLLADGSRGALLICMLVALFAIVNLQVRRPFFAVAIGYTFLPFIATLLLNFRQQSVSATQPPSGLGDAYRQFLSESNMVPVMAMALHGINNGIINYSYGIDLLSLPGWYVPRALWPGKPLPLDFRINSALGLNDGDVFGTPVSIFGGVYINFTPVLYVFVFVLFALLLVYAYRHLRDDRLLKVFFLIFVLDIVRVGDLSRETVTFSLSLAATLAIRSVVLSRSEIAAGHAYGPTTSREVEIQRAYGTPRKSVTGASRGAHLGSFGQKEIRVR
jgi:hypothetical protein